MYGSVFLVLLVLLFASCGSDEPQPIMGELVDPQVGVDPPTNPASIAAGAFTSFAHSLSGSATLYTDAQGARTLHFENFTMTKGPDVYVFFSKTNNYSEANTVPLSMLKNEYTNTSLSFEIPSMVNTSTHPFVLVYCVQFSSLFGYSELKK